MIRPRQLRFVREGVWAESAPTHCPAGHPLGPNTVLVGARACSCGGHHRTHRCRTCGEVTYTPELGEQCSDVSFDGRSARLTP